MDWNTLETATKIKIILRINPFGGHGARSGSWGRYARSSDDSTFLQDGGNLNNERERHRDRRE
jgi:hypothetical protein